MSLPRSPRFRRIRSWRNRYDRIEQQFERAMRLRALEDLRTKEQSASLPDRRLECHDAVLEITLAPTPPAAQRRLRVEPSNASNACGVGACTELEHRAVIEEDVREVVQPLRDWIRRIEPRRQHRPGRVELLLRQRAPILDEVVLHRKPEESRQVRRRRADRNHRAAVLDEGADLWQRGLRANPAKMRAIFGGDVVRRGAG